MRHLMFVLSPLLAAAYLSQASADCADLQNQSEMNQCAGDEYA